MATPEPPSLTGLPSLQSPSSVEKALAAAVAANLAAQEIDASQDFDTSVHDAEPPSTTPHTGRVQKARARKSPGSGAKRSEQSKRKFICSFSHYGCDTALSSKNEWKRHVAIQHLQLGFYRCDVGSCNPDANPSTPAHKKAFNDFNRKDLFTQHHRRMHKPVGSDGSALPTDQTSADWRSFEDSLEEVRQRCWVEKRRPPMRSTCGFCGRVFEGEGSWNERMEHVGGHYSRDLPENCKEEREDEDLTNWSLQEGIVKESATGRPVLVDQPPSASDRGYNGGGGHDRKMLEDNVDGLYGNDTTDDLTGGYTSMNGSGRPGSSSDRLEDLINKLINPKKPRMTKRLQWKCDCGLDDLVDFAEDNGDDERAFRNLSKISIVCQNSQSPFMHTGAKGQLTIIRCNELVDHVAREGKTVTENGPPRTVPEVADTAMQESNLPS